MGSKFSILIIYAILFLLGCICFTIYNYNQLSEGEGWGMVGMFGLAGFGILLLFTGIALHNLIKNRKLANLIGLIIAAAFTLALVFGS